MSEIGSLQDLSPLLLLGINTPASAIYLVDKSAFIIGRADTCDAIMSFSDEIGREHAKIERKANEYVIMDLNSTNKTFLNGYMLEPGVPQPLHPGDRIMFAASIFEVEAINI